MWAGPLNISVISRHLFLLITISQTIFANYESQHDLMGPAQTNGVRGWWGVEGGRRPSEGARGEREKASRWRRPTAGGIKSAARLAILSSDELNDAVSEKRRRENDPPLITKWRQIVRNSIKETNGGCGAFIFFHACGAFEVLDDIPTSFLAVLSRVVQWWASMRSSRVSPRPWPLEPEQPAPES